MAKRRSNGEGSFWQLPDRTWVYQITIGRKEDGTLQRKSFKGRTKAICKERKAEWLAQQEAAQKQAKAAQEAAANLDVLEARLGHTLESEILFEDAFLEWLKLETP